MSRLSDAVVKKFSRLSLGGALTLVIVAAGIIVAAGYTMYRHDPNQKYDLARPGEKDNQSLRVQDSEQGVADPVTADALQQKIDYLEEEIEVLSEINRFDPTDLDDQTIRLLPSDQPSQ